MGPTTGASQAAQQVKNLPANAGDARDEGLIPVPERSPGGGSGNPCSILAWERGAWLAIVHGLAELGMTE